MIHIRYKKPFKRQQIVGLAGLKFGEYF